VATPTSQSESASAGDEPKTENEQPPEQQSTTAEQQPETFDRAYIQRLRDEAASHRVKAKRADALAERLVTAMAAGTNRLADPTDLAYSDDLLDEDGYPDEGKVAEAIEQLIAKRPHLASRRPRDSDVGQGTQAEVDTLSLAALLRAGAG
jgi:hypothetical protein